MVKSFLIICILCYISITISYNFNDRLKAYTSDEKSEEVLNNTIDSIFSSSSIDHCIPVIAVKELGCILSKRNILFQGIFQSVCEQHHLCYACGFVHHLTARECNRLALISMYDLCSQNRILPFFDCLKQRFSAIKLLRQHIYRARNVSAGFVFECHQQCVFDYLYTK